MSNFIKHPIVAGIILIVIGLLSVKYVEPNLPEGNIIPFIKYIFALGIIVYGYYDTFKNNELNKKFIILILFYTIFFIIMIGAGVLEVLLYWVAQLIESDSRLHDILDKIEF